VNHIAVRLVYAHKRIQQIVEGTPTELIKSGSLVTANLEAELVTCEELEAAALKQGFTSLDEIERAYSSPAEASRSIPRSRRRTRRETRPSCNDWIESSAQLAALRHDCPRIKNASREDRKDFSWIYFFAAFAPLRSLSSSASRSHAPRARDLGIAPA
jgi:hypothetical protein